MDPLRYTPPMFDAKRVALGLAAIGGLCGAVAGAQAALPSDGSVGTSNQALDQARDESPVQVPAPSDKALRYHHGNTTIWATEQLLSIALPLLLLFTGLSAWLRSVAGQVAGGRFYPTLAIYFVLLSVLLFVLELPLAYFIGFAREHAYGLSTQHLSKWAGDQAKGLGVGVVMGLLVLWVPYLLLAKSPQRWWLWTSALALPFYTLTLIVTPLWIAPLFNKFGPMKDKVLEADVLAVARRAGVEGARVFEVNKSVDTTKVNAYVTGVGGSKRIVLWDTLIARLSPAQAQYVVGHELGHYVLGHVWTSILLSTVLTFLGLFGAHRLSGLVLHHFGDRMGFHQLADVASMPLLMLLLTLFSLAITPAALAFSRYHEREADRFGLELTHDNHAAATAFVTLQEQNLAIPRPSLLYKIFRASHPPIGERVDFINSYRPWTQGQAGRYQHLLAP
jgi:Zn-dependent protease with chaperone function